MAMALERGSQMQAPLGPAVIGGLVMSTFATHPMLPSVFAIVTGKRTPQFPSIYPDDPDSVQTPKAAATSRTCVLDRSAEGADNAQGR